MLAEIQRVLRPGGTFLVTVPAYQSSGAPRTRSATTSAATAPARFATRMPLRAWSSLRLSYFNTLLFPPIAAVRILRQGPP